MDNNAQINVGVQIPQDDEKLVRVFLMDGSFLPIVDNGMMDYLFNCQTPPKIIFAENARKDYKKVLINWDNVLYIEEP